MLRLGSKGVFSQWFRCVRVRADFIRPVRSFHLEPLRYSPVNRKAYADSYAIQSRWLGRYNLSFAAAGFNISDFGGMFKGSIPRVEEVCGGNRCAVGFSSRAEANLLRCFKNALGGYGYLYVDSVKTLRRD